MIVHAGVLVPAGDRAALERLARLAAIVPAPRLALRRQLGVFAAASKDRRKIMPAPLAPERCHPAPKAPSRIPWAELLRRVWYIDSLRCERCGGRLHPVAVVLDSAEAQRYLRAIGEFSPLPTLARSRGPPAVA